MNDLNHIGLNPFLVAGLYRTSIVDLAEDPAGFVPSEKIELLPKKDEWEWLGENKKHLLFVVDEEGSGVLPDDRFQFLTGILSACNLKMSDIALINHHQYPKSTYKELIARFQPRIIFLTGIDPAGLGLPINFPQFQIQPFSNVSFLYVPALSELEKDKVLKSRLWVCLRRLFNL